MASLRKSAAKQSKDESREKALASSLESEAASGFSGSAPGADAPSGELAKPDAVKSKAARSRSAGRSKKRAPDEAEPRAKRPLLRKAPVKPAKAEMSASPAESAPASVADLTDPAARPVDKARGAAAASAGGTRRKRATKLNPGGRRRAQAQIEKGAPTALADTEDFNEAFPLSTPSAVAQNDAALPRTSPAVLPDIELIRRAEAERALALAARRMKRDAQKRQGRKAEGRAPAHEASTAPLSRRLKSLVIDALLEAADQLLGRTRPEFALIPLNPVRVLLAYSGGRDSSALLDVLAKLFHDKQQALIETVEAVYINHGLSPHADEWEAHCRAECEKRSIRFKALKVVVNGKEDGIEAAARDARYAALSDYAASAGFDVVMTAHHEDDRIETFLLQWLRGAGPEGLAAFPRSRVMKMPSAVEPGEFARDGRPGPILLVRPWRTVLRADVERYVKQRRIAYVDDESNDDPKYLRNRIRHEVVPLLEKIRPGFRSAAARSVELVAEAADILRSVAMSDLEACRSKINPGGLAIYRLLELIPARQAWCLRAWMSEEGMALPGKARLEEALRQVRETHADTSLSIRVKGKEIRRWGSDLVIRDVPKRTSAAERTALVRWSGGHEIVLPGWDGVVEVLPCAPDEAGISVDRLMALDAKLEVRSKCRSSKMKLWPLRPAKSLKDLYAEAGIAPFDRDELPLLLLNGEIVFAAGLGMDVRRLDEPENAPERVRFRYRPVQDLWKTKALANYGDLPEAARRERESLVKAAQGAQRRIEAFIESRKG